MRGKRLRGNFYPSTPRIIPAHAGQTVCGSLRAVECTDHPRACGANPLLIIIVTFVRWTTARIIPAHAGQTESLQPKNTVHPDHPRACGANMALLVTCSRRYGSSPRMRGKQSDFMRKLLSAGPSIIGFAQWLQSSYYCSCLQSSAKTPISRGTTPTSLFLGFQNSITLLLLT